MTTDQLKQTTDDLDRQQIDRAEKATHDYLAAAKSWVEADNNQRDAETVAMNDGGETVSNDAAIYTVANPARKGAEIPLESSFKGL